MEDGLRDMNSIELLDNPSDVLILVVMEDGLRAYGA